MKYQEIKAAKEAKMNQLITDCRVFFAFSNEQFEKNKTPLKEGEKYVRIGMGGFATSSMCDKLNNGFSDLEKWEKSEVKKHKQVDEQIKYELYNHECFYTGDPSEVFDILPYSQERIIKVYQSERKHANA